MSSAITVYAVALEALNATIGSRNAELVAAIADQQARFLSSIDDIRDDAEIKCLDAVTHLINGEQRNEDYGYLYGYALEALCLQLGTELPNICGITGATEWIEQIDVILSERKVPVSLNTLVYRGSPIKIPEPDDYPFIGTWPVPEIASALNVIERIDKRAVDREVAETLKQIEGWLTAALELGVPIIGFLS